ncbi:MAG: hypothetical protein ABR509_06855 [Candidatus Limnocylindria bacterium]
MSQDDLRAQLRDGESLEEIASAAGVDYADVTQAMVDAARAELDDAVADGDITQEQADQIIEHLTEGLEEGNFPFGGPHHGGPWGRPRH